MKCGSRSQTPAMYHQFPEDEDYWRDMPDGTQTCSFCGSVHPDDAVDIMYRYAIGIEGYRFEPAVKNYKIYVSKPHVNNAKDGGIKFYEWHMPEDDNEFQAMKQLATAKYKAYMAERYGS